MSGPFTIARTKKKGIHNDQGILSYNTVENKNPAHGKWPAMHFFYCVFSERKILCVYNMCGRKKEENIILAPIRRSIYNVLGLFGHRAKCHLSNLPMPPYILAGSTQCNKNVQK